MTETEFYNMSEKDVTEFSTRITPEQLQKIKAYAYYRRTSIQAVTMAAVDEFFKEREDEVSAALKAWENKDKPL